MIKTSSVRKLLLGKAIAASMGIGYAIGAQAMPLAPAVSRQESNVIRVAGGCGPGWHRGPYGGCLRNFANPAAHACPRGFHVGPYGGCRGNGR